MSEPSQYRFTSRVVFGFAVLNVCVLVEQEAATNRFRKVENLVASALTPGA